MSFTKHATFEDVQVLGIKGAQKRVREASLDKFAEYSDFRTDDGYLYCRIRAISSRCNKNWDSWPSVELAGGQEAFDKISSQKKEAAFTVEADSGQTFGYSTFLGKPVFVDHHNSDPDRARGVVVDAKLHIEDAKTSALDPYYSSSDVDPLHLPPTWVELMLEIDAEQFPKFAKAIIEGANDSKSGIDGFSMGCDVTHTICNVCDNRAETPDEFCEHIAHGKGGEYDYVNPETGKKTSRKAAEHCYGIQFFELSGVFDPADETALTREIIHKEGKVAEALFPPCPNCGEVSGFENYPWANKTMACKNCQHLISPEDLAGIFNTQSLDLMALPETEHPLGPHTGSEVQCGICKGQGMIIEGPDDFIGKDCPKCQGTGKQVLLRPGDRERAETGDSHKDLFEAAPDVLQYINEIPEQQHPLGPHTGATAFDPNQIYCPNCDSDNVEPQDSVRRGFNEADFFCWDCGKYFDPDQPKSDADWQADYLAIKDLPETEHPLGPNYGKVASNPPEMIPAEPEQDFVVLTPEEEAAYAATLNQLPTVEAKTAEELPGYDRWKLQGPPEGPVCPQCESALDIDPYEQSEVCTNPECDYANGRDWDAERDAQLENDYYDSLEPPDDHYAKTALVSEEEQVHSPHPVDTLREETVCGVCGSTLESDKCDVCGWVRPPKGLDNPDLDRAKEVNPEIGASEVQTPLEQTGLESDNVGARNPFASSTLRSDMAKWRLSVHPKVAGRINPVEKPTVESNTSATDEPVEKTLSDEERPTTKRIRTARDVIEAAKRERELERHADAAAGAPEVATPDKNVDTEGIGGVIEPSNEAASQADAQVDVEGQGGTGVENVSADEENATLVGGGEAGGFDSTKTTEGSGPTKTWSGTGGSAVETQTSPVQGGPFPVSGEGVHSHTKEALDAEPFPKDDEGLSGGTAVRGNQPVDSVGIADQRVDVLKPVTSPENNSGPTKTWSGTDGSGVERQQDPVTRDTLEGAEGVKASSHIFAAFKLADLEVELGLTDASRKYERVAELEEQDAITVQASLDYAQKVKRSNVIHPTKTAKRLPSLSRSASAPKQNGNVELDEELFLS